jgi:hypothetical protein
MVKTVQLGLSFLSESVENFGVFYPSVHYSELLCYDTNSCGNLLDVT